MSELTIIVPGKPIAKKRPKFARRGKFVTTYNCQESEEGRFMWHLAMAKPPGWEPVTGPVRLEVEFAMPIPTSASRRKHCAMVQGEIMHIKKPDLDNLAKMVKDCANGILWRDDSQVVALVATKFYAEIPQTRITIRWEDLPCQKTSSKPRSTDRQPSAAVLDAGAATT